MTNKATKEKQANQALATQEQSETTSPTEEKKIFTIDEIARAMMEFDICILNQPIMHSGVELNCAKRIRSPLVKDRIEAVRFSKDQFGFESSDAITAHIASSILVFGRRSDEEYDETGKLTSVQMTGEVKVAVDTLIELPYEEHVNLAHLMGKS